MKRRDLGGAAFVVATSLTSLARAQQSPTATPAKQQEYLFWLTERDRLSVREAAATVLAELDGIPLDTRRISAVYQRSARALRKRSTEATFVNRLLKYRDGLGAPRERALQGVEGGFKFLPNYPNGQYSIATFDTAFGTTPTIFTEQLTFERDPSHGDQWMFVDYYLATKPFYAY